MDRIKELFKRKGLGFYLSAVAALLLLCVTVVYSVAFSLAENGNLVVHPEVVAVSFVGLAAFVALSLFSPTERYAGAALFVLSYVAFLLFVLNGYMYLTDVFYDGISLSAFGTLNGGYAFSLIGYIVVCVLSAVGVFMPQKKAFKAVSEVVNE